MSNTKRKSSNYIPSSTFREIEEKISKNPSIILPVGGMEPVGEQCAIGAISECIMSISACLAEKCDMLLQPLLPYSNTTSFRAFGGSTGVKKSCYESFLTSLIKDCAAWGVKYIFILDGTFLSYPIVNKVVNRFEKNKKKSISITVLNWQHNNDIRSFIAGRLKGLELGRSEFGIISMAAYINPSLVINKIAYTKQKALCTQDIYLRWKKLGQDPEKFRKFFPDCRTSVINSESDPEFGKELFEYIVTCFEKIIRKQIA